MASSDGSPAVMYATMPSSPAARSSAKRCEMRCRRVAGAMVISLSAKLRAGAYKCPCPYRRGRKDSGSPDRRFELRSAFHQAGKRVSGFERGDNSFGAREQSRGFQRGFIGHSGVFGAMLVGEPGVLGADGRIIEPRGNGMRRGNLPVVVLQNVGVRALQNAGARAGESLASGQPRGVFAERRCRGRRLRCQPSSLRHLARNS